MTTIKVFFLVLNMTHGTVVIPTVYTSNEACTVAGQAAENNKTGWGPLSWTCVPQDQESEK